MTTTISGTYGSPPSVADTSPAGGSGQRQPTGPAPLRRSSALFAFLPVAAALAICLRGMGDREMWNNEYATWHATTLSLSDFEELLRRTDLVHVVYYVFMRGWISAVGDTPFQLRIPSAVAMAICAGLVALIGRRLVSTPVGVFAGLIFAAIPAVSRYGQEARSYAFVTVAAALATLMLLRALERPKVSRLVAYGLAVAVMGLVHFVSLTILVAHFVYWLYTTRGEGNEERRWRVAFGCGFGLLGVIWLPALASAQSGSISWIKADTAAIKAFPADMFLSAPVAGLIGILALLGLVCLWFGSDKRLRPVAAMLLAWGLVPPIFVLVTFPVLHLFLPRYVLAVLPAWALLAAAGAYLGGQLVWRHLAGVTAVAATVGVIGVGLPAQGVIRQSPVDGQPDYRAAIITINESQRAGDGVVFNDPFGTLSDLARESWDYEMRDRKKPRDVFLDKTAAQRASFSASECPVAKTCLKNEPRLWLIYTGWSKDPFDGMPGDRAELLKRDYKVQRTYPFTDVDLVLLVNRAPATK